MKNKDVKLFQKAKVGEIKQKQRCKTELTN